MIEVVAPSELLSAVYQELDYFDESRGTYVPSLSPGTLTSEDWIEKGDWLLLANRIGDGFQSAIEKIFFIKGNPVIVFARCASINIVDRLELYSEIWCMARPRLLFMAIPGELAVYDLTSKPPRKSEKWGKLEPLQIVQSVAEVAEKLKRFHREQLESGRLFETEERFGNLKDRADKALIRDLRTVRQMLAEAGLGGDNLRYAHALIGRSIFIRYLEDRKILTENTYLEIAKNNPQWTRLLKSEPKRAGSDFSENPSLYLRILENKDFTYALYRKLATDFNGDMFPGVDQEESIIEDKHLKLIQDILFGDVGPQLSLFFYAYRFKIIPIELISSIYETFYHDEVGKVNTKGSYYTPPALVEFVLSQVLTPERLTKNPRIIDPACGSGIFLVEAFRRIIRFQTQKQKRQLTFNQLCSILRDQLAGIDVNLEAIRVAAFSLYLALMHYLEPPDIQEQINRGNRLPNLVVNDENSSSYNTLLAANSFDIKYIESNQVLKNRFSTSSADIVVGNPPFGSPGPNDIEARKQNKIAMEWCEERKLPVGDRESSQVFIWRAIDLLKPGGTASMLAAAGVLFKLHKNSVAFRKKWLDSCLLSSVFNFSATRDVFFKDSKSPFIALVFHKDMPDKPHHMIQYWSSKRTRIIDGLQSVVFYKSDLKLLRHEDDLSDGITWKTFWWGNIRDKNLIDFLRINKSLNEYASEIGEGYIKANNRKDADWLKSFKELPEKHFRRYGSLDNKFFIPAPTEVYRKGVKEVFTGMRILVRRGIRQSQKPKGQIIARLETEPFCFTDAIHGLKLKDTEEWHFKIVLGILWSSVARYYFFMTTADWGNRNFAIHKEELLSLPIVFPDNTELREKIVGIVDELRSYDPPVRNVVYPHGIPEDEITEQRKNLERRLDQSVFELYNLNPAEIDLIHDMCNVNLDYFYLREKSEAAKPLLPKHYSFVSAASDELSEEPIHEYLTVFMNNWAGYLEDSTEFRYQIHTPPESDSMVAIIFSIHDSDDSFSQNDPIEKNSWNTVLRRLDEAMTVPISHKIYIEGLVRIVTEKEIILIKRNERRFWTKSMAREDAEATLVQAMNRKSIGDVL